MFGNGPPYGGQQPYGGQYPPPGRPGYYPPQGLSQPQGYPQQGFPFSPPPGFPPPRRSNTGLIIGICAGVGILVIALVAVLLLTRGGKDTSGAQHPSASSTASSPVSNPGKPIERVELARIVKTQLDSKTGEQSASVICAGDLAAAIGSTQRCVLARTNGMLVGLTVSVVGNDPVNNTLQLHIEADAKPLVPAQGAGARSTG